MCRLINQFITNFNFQLSKKKNLGKKYLKKQLAALIFSQNCFHLGTSKAFEIG